MLISLQMCLKIKLFWKCLCVQYKVRAYIQMKSLKACKREIKSVMNTSGNVRIHSQQIHTIHAYCKCWSGTPAHVSECTCNVTFVDCLYLHIHPSVCALTLLEE